MAESKTKNKKNKKSVIVQAESNATEEANETLQRDVFDEFLFHAANYMYVRRKLFISLAVVALVAIVSGYGSFKYIEHKDNKRNEGLFEVEKIIYDSALSKEELSKKANPLLEDFIANNPGTKQQNLAIFYRAGLRFKEGKLEDAENDLKVLITSFEPGTDLAFLANLYLANILRDQKKIEEAVEVLQAAKSSAKSDAMIDIVLMEQAELYMEADQQDKAKESLEVLLKDYPKSLYVNKAKQLLELL